MPGLRRRTAAGIAALAALVTVSACGTRLDRDEYYAQRRGVGSGTATTVQGLGQGAGSGSGTGGAVAPGADGTAPTGGAGSTTTTAAGTGGGGDGGSGSAADPAAGVSADIVGDTVKIGVHLPETGAAPLPTDWKGALDAIAAYLNAERPLAGRTLQFLVEDDGYDPAMGLAACRKLADEDVLLVIGHTQPAVEDACAGLFGDRAIPYLMRGTYESLLSDRRLSWFGTISDDRQGGMLADYAIHQLGASGKKGAVVFENDQTAARDSFVDHFGAGGGSIVVNEESTPRQADFAAVIQKLQEAGAEFVFLSMPPVDAIKLSVQAYGQGYHPTWLGGATYWNYNMVLESAGMAMDGAVVFSPWPSVDSGAAAEYRSVMQRYGQDPTDVGLVLWGWLNMLRDILDRAGTDLSRAAVVRALQSYDLAMPTWNPISYRPDNHLGANAVAVFRGDGQARRWRQIADFAQGF